MGRALAVVLAALVAGCGGAAASPSARSTIPETLVENELPPEPSRPEGGVATFPVYQCFDEAGDPVIGPETGEGILFSDETAAYVGHLRVSYDELRSLYSIDQRTWQREREVYSRHLEAADTEIDAANERAERDWWERHGDEAGLIGGFIIGVAVTVGIVAAVDKVSE